MVDTNVLVSAVIRDRLPEQVLLWCLRQPNVDWLVTPQVLSEYMEVIRRPKFALPGTTIAWWSELLVADTRGIEPSVEIDFPPDRKDAPFLICAASGNADFLITGDGDFSEAQALIESRIVSVRGFAQALAPDILSPPDQH